jgi:glycosyltransferase involved in cell wall biosynthesis
LTLTVLSVAYPLAPVTADPVGGAEQVLSQLDRALVARGYRSLVVAPEGSRVAGELLPVPAVPSAIGEAEVESAQAAVRARIGEAVRRRGVDVIHLHGIDFPSYLPESGPPVLVTLHLPLDWYPPDALRPERADVDLHPVSTAQAATAPPNARLGAPIENGVELLHVPVRKRTYAFALGRICPEKGFDDALDAVRLAKVPFLMAGTVFPYAAHEAHFQEAIRPRLSWRRRWIGTVEGERKRYLLGAARVLLVPSKALETSSLVAMEALAAGTPVVAYPNGALPEIVEDGHTGFLVEGVEGMLQGIRRAGEIDPEACRAIARERFSAERMVERYIRRYVELASRPRHR